MNKTKQRNIQSMFVDVMQLAMINCLLYAKRIVMFYLELNVIVYKRSG